MTISKTEWLEKRRVDVIPLIKRASELLEEASSLPVHVDYKVLPVPAIARDEFIRAFVVRGWAVELIFDQRDGDFWRFS
jgi:hypothetical protein